MRRPHWTRWTRGLAATLLVLGLAGTAVATLQHGDTWRWRRFGLREGLPSERIDHVLVSGDGTSWVFTPSGPAWFDGFRWHAVPNLAQASFEQVSWLVSVDERVVFVSDGALWAADPGGVHRLPVPLPGVGWLVEAVSALEGVLLVELVRGEDRGEVQIVALESGVATPMELPCDLAHSSSAALRGGVHGPAYLQCGDAIYRWRDGVWSPFFPIVGSDPHRLVEDGAGGGLAAFRFPDQARGLWQWTSGGEPVQLEEGVERWVRAIASSPSGDLIVAYDSGRLRWRRDGEWSNERQVPVRLGHARGLWLLPGGDLWLATESGLYFRRAAALWSQAYPSEEHANVILRRSNGDLWVGASDGLWVRRKGGEFEQIDEILERPVASITGLAEDHDGNVWVSSGENFLGALRFDGHAWQRIGKEQGLGAGMFHSIRVDSRGRLWFLGLHIDPYTWGVGPGAYCYDGERFEPWGTARGLLNGRMYDFAEGPDGALWFGTYGGLSRFHEDEWRHWTAKDGLRSSKIFALTLDHDGRVWFAHQRDGLGVLDGDELRYYSVEDGLAGSDVWGLATDERGWVWATTHSGLSVFHDGVLSSLGAETGLPNPRLWGVLPERGQVFVGTLGDGLAVLDLDLIDRRAPRIDFAGRVVEGHDTVVRWVARAPWAAIPSVEVGTRYRVDAGSWSRWGFGSEATLVDLEPGEHRIEVQARGLLGDLSTPVALPEFKTPVPYHRRAGFLIPIAALSVAVVALMVLLRARMRRDAVLRRERERLVDLVENANDLIYQHDTEGRLMALNPAARKVFGLSREDALGCSVEELVAEDDRSRWRQVVADACRGAGPGTYDLEVVSRSGARVSLEVSTRVLRGDEEPLVLQNVARDVTRRRELEGQLVQSQKMQAIGQLAGGIAHDFNNMLLVINGYSELLLQSLPEGDAGRARVEQIHRAGERAAALTRQLLAFSRKQVLRPERLDLGALVLDMGELLERVLSEDIELCIEVDERATVVEADPVQLQRVVLNLAVNARDEMPRGGTLRIATARIDGSPALVELSVSDTGRGMDEETRERLFEPFFTTKEQGRGTGLGLSTVYGIVEQSGGHIEVESERGRGTNFLIRLPLIDAPADEPTPVAAPPGRPEGGRRAAILLVEDGEEVRAWLNDVLTEEGYEVLPAEGGEAALQMAEAHAGPLDLLVTDVVMPGMSGPELARRLSAVRPEVEVLYVSGYTGEALASRGAREGLHFLQKPFQRTDLLWKVRELLAGRRGARRRRLTTGG